MLELRAGPLQLAFPASITTSQPRKVHPHSHQHHCASTNAPAGSPGRLVQRPVCREGQRQRGALQGLPGPCIGVRAHAAIGAPARGGGGGRDGRGGPPEQGGEGGLPGQLPLEGLQPDGGILRAACVWACAGDKCIMWSNWSRCWCQAAPDRQRSVQVPELCLVHL